MFQEKLHTPDSSDTGFIFEVNLKISDKKRNKNNSFPICPEKQWFLYVNFDKHMSFFKPKLFTHSEKLICDWGEKSKNFASKIAKVLCEAWYDCWERTKKFLFTQKRWLKEHTNFIF